VTKAHTNLGYWYEVLRHDPSPTHSPEPLALEMLGNAHATIRAIRIQVRTFHVLGMTPREISRAVEWAESGWIQALAALHRGEPCAFSVLLSSGIRAEWCVTPTPYFPLADANRHIRQIRDPHPELSPSFLQAASKSGTIHSSGAS
jgi:hypothetical protein